MYTSTLNTTRMRYTCITQWLPTPFEIIHTGFMFHLVLDRLDPILVYCFHVFFEAIHMPSILLNQVHTCTCGQSFQGENHHLYNEHQSLPESV